MADLKPCPFCGRIPVIEDCGTDRYIIRCKCGAVREVPAAGYELTKDEAYAIAEFIDCNIFEAIRNDSDWDSFQALRNLVHAYEKCCAMSGFVGLTDKREEGQEEEDDESSR